MRAVICGLVLMLLAMGVEMTLFLIGASRVDEKVAKRERAAKARGVMDRTKLGGVPMMAAAPDAPKVSEATAALRSLGRDEDAR